MIAINLIKKRIRIKHDSQAPDARETFMRLLAIWTKNPILELDNMPVAFDWDDYKVVMCAGWTLEERNRYSELLW